MTLERHFDWVVKEPAKEAVVTATTLKGCKQTVLGVGFTLQASRASQCWKRAKQENFSLSQTNTIITSNMKEFM